MITLTAKYIEKAISFSLKALINPIYVVGFKQLPELTIVPLGLEEIALVFRDKWVKMEMGFEGKAWKMKFEQVGSELSVCVFWIGVVMGEERFKLILLYVYINTNRCFVCIVNFEISLCSVLTKLLYVGMYESMGTWGLIFYLCLLQVATGFLVMLCGGLLIDIL